MAAIASTRGSGASAISLVIFRFLVLFGIVLLSTTTGHTHITNRTITFGDRSAVVPPIKPSVSSESTTSGTPPPQLAQQSVTAATPDVSQDLVDAFVRAAGAGNISEVRSLIAGNVNLNAEASRNAKDIGGSDIPGRIALPFAALMGQLEVVRALLEAKANINVEQFGDTALMLASQHHDPAIVKALINAGADVNRVGNSGNGNKQALSYALERGLHNDKQDRDRQLEVLTTLIDAGADVNGFVKVGKGKQLGSIPLIHALHNATLVKLLLDRGANVNAIELDGDTALIAAARAGHADSVKLLLDAGANKDATEQNRYYNSGCQRPQCMQLNFATALIHAAAKGHADVVRELLAAGASKDVTDHWGHTALEAATFNQHDQVVKLLQDAGAKH